MLGRKVQEPTWEEKIVAVIDVLSELESNQIDTVSNLAKEQRDLQQRISAFTKADHSTKEYDYSVPAAKVENE